MLKDEKNLLKNEKEKVAMFPFSSLIKKKRGAHERRRLSDATHRLDSDTSWLGNTGISIIPGGTMAGGSRGEGGENLGEIYNPWWHQSWGFMRRRRERNVGREVIQGDMGSSKKVVKRAF